MKHQKPYARELMPISATTIMNGGISRWTDTSQPMSTMPILTGSRNILLNLGRGYDAGVDLWITPRGRG